MTKDNKQTRPFPVRLNTEEMSRLEQYAAAASLTKGAYIKKVLWQSFNTDKESPISDHIRAKALKDMLDIKTLHEKYNVSHELRTEVNRRLEALWDTLR